MSTGTAPPPSRSSWKPSDAIAARLDALAAKYAKRDEIEAECKAELTDLAKNHGVPIAALSERFGMVRKTIYRHIGRKMS